MTQSSPFIDSSELDSSERDNYNNNEDFEEL